jgi:hypothetical protein
MESMIVAYSFAASLAIAACVVVLFSRSIDEALLRVIPAEMVSSWRLYVKFALFVVTFAGGLRLSELAQLFALRAPGAAPLAAEQSLLEVLRSVSGSLIAAASALLAFFAATLVVYASRRVYFAHRADAEKKAETRIPREPERPAADRQPKRQPVGAERHAGAKDRQRTEESAKDRPRTDEPGRFL